MSFRDRKRDWGVPSILGMQGGHSYKGKERRGKPSHA